MLFRSLSAFCRSNRTFLVVLLVDKVHAVLGRLGSAFVGVGKDRSYRLCERYSCIN